MPAPTPVPIKNAMKIKFCEALAECGSVGPAAKAAGIHRRTILKWRAEDEEFDLAVEDAFENCWDDAVTEVHRRGVLGHDKPILHMGKPVYLRNPESGDLILDDNFEPILFTEKVFSDPLLQMFVKGHRSIYREKGPTDPSTPTVQIGNMTVTYVTAPGMTEEDYAEDDKLIAHFEETGALLDLGPQDYSATHGEKVRTDGSDGASAKLPEAVQSAENSDPV